MCERSGLMNEGKVQKCDPMNEWINVKEESRTSCESKLM
jgi:hypothetical protein